VTAADGRIRPLTHYAAVLTDLDGTLVDSEGPVRRAWTAFAARRGLDAETVIRRAQGRPAHETAAELVPAAELEAEVALLAAAESTDTEGIVALPGAVELLSGAVNVAVVTSGWRRLAEMRLHAAGLAAPAVMVCSDDVTAGKPAPEPYLRGARALGVDAGDCVVLEDAPAGIVAGRAAGATVIALRTTHADADLAAAGPDAIVDSIAALL
jgi:mannitol-1-/sugar-/sorbitol-6-phosphatase